MGEEGLGERCGGGTRREARDKGLGERCGGGTRREVGRKIHSLYRHGTV